MTRYALLLTAICAVAIASPANAWIWHPGGGGGASGLAYTGPLDVAGTNFTAWYGLRAGSAAQAAAGTQKLIKPRNTVTNETCDILLDAAGSGMMGLTANCTGSSNGHTPSFFCTLSGGVNCAVVTWYTLIGPSTRDMTQTNPALQPTLLLTGGPCSLPTVQFSGLQIILSAPFTPASRLSSYSVIAKVVTPNAEADLITSQANNGIFSNNLNTGGFWWLSTSGGGTIVAPATNVFHAGNGAINTNGLTSFLYIDTSETTSTAINGDLATNPIDISGDQTSGTTVVDVSEGGFSDNNVWTTTTALAVQANQHTYGCTP